MDIAYLIGFILGIFMFVLTVATGVEGISALWNFYDVPGLILVVGGSLSGTLASFRLPDFLNGLRGLGIAFRNENADPSEVIQNIISLSNVARKEGLLALEEAANSVDDEFLRKGIMLVVDGTDPELVRGILETELSCIEQRHGKVIGFWEKWGELAPAWGMMGTLIGLVLMLKNLDDPTTIGPNMAMAIITTLYGALIANWICSPTVAKLRANNDYEMMMKEVTVEGLLSIQAGENPRVIEEKLKSFLSPGDRVIEAEADAFGGQ